MNLWTTLLFLMCWVFALGQQTTQRSIVEAPLESYTVRLPVDFTNERFYPVVFIFDPLGNGGAAITHFEALADQFGYLLVASNETSNGRHAENFELASRMINDALNHYPIVEERMYLTGFSGGSRLASAIAVLSDQFAGVVGCGSGFSPNASELPRGERFSYVGIVGDLDMNYAEMYENALWLDKQRMDNLLIGFDGPHQWPEEKQLLGAFSWLEQQALKKGLPSIWEQLKTASYQRELAGIWQDTLFPSIHLLNGLERMQKRYPQQFEQNLWLQTKGRAILTNQELRSQRKVEQTLMAFETDLIAQDNELLLAFFLQPKSKYKQVLDRIQERKMQLGMAGTPLYTKHFKRLLRNLYANLYEQGIGYGAVQAQHLEKAYYSNELLVEIRPGRSLYLLEVELTAAYKGPKNAVRTLRSMLERKQLTKKQVLTSKLPELLGARKDYEKLMTAY